MCRICVEWQSGKLTTKEAFQNLGEMIKSTEDEETQRHLFELSDRLLDDEVPYSEPDQEMDAAWYRETHSKRDD